MSILSRLKEMKEALKADQAQTRADEAKLGELRQALGQNRPQQQERSLGEVQLAPDVQSSVLDFGQKAYGTGMSATPVFVEDGAGLAPHPMQTPVSGSAETKQQIKHPTQDGPVQGQ